jgi:DNA primase
LGRIPDEIVQQVRDHSDVVGLVGRTVTLKRAGRNYKGLCPFHDEKTPSFNVNPDRGSYYCFGCQEGGDVFSFLMKIEGLGFAEAVRALARDCGIAIPEAEAGASGLSERIVEANALLLERYRAELAREGNAGAAYLAERGLDAGAIEHFEIGYAPDRWGFAVEALRGARIPAELGERAGLLAQRSSGGHYDRLRGRVIFPIRDARGRVIGFGGRALGPDQTPKYLNTPETPIFRKREALYGLRNALEPIRRKERVVVVEGYFDCIALHRAGIGEAVATCGTALTPDHAGNLRRRTQNVILFFDGDAAGQRAVERALEVLLPSGLRVRAVLLPTGDDPDSFLVREGGEALRALVDTAPAALDVVFERAVAGVTDTPWAKADAVAALAPLLARIVSAVERSEYCSRLGLVLGTNPRHIEAAVHAAERGEDARDALPAAPRRSSPEERNLCQLTRSLVEHPRLLTRVSRDALETLIPAGPFAQVLQALVAADAAGRASDLEAVAGRLEGEALRLLRSVAASDDPPELSVAEQTIDDTLQWLHRQHLKRRKRALTERLREPGADVGALLEEKQQLIAQENAIPRPRAGAML